MIAFAGRGDLLGPLNRADSQEAFANGRAKTSAEDDVNMVRSARRHRPFETIVQLVNFGRLELLQLRCAKCRDHMAIQKL